MKAIDVSRYLIVSLYLFTTFYAVVYLAHDSVGLWRWQSSGYLESRLAENGDSTSVFRKAIPSDFVTAPIPATGDTVLSIGGIRMFHDHHQRFVPSVRNDIEPFAPNEPLEITFVHAGDTLHSVIAMHPPSRRLTALQIFVDLLRHLIALSMLFVGGWGLLTRGNNVVVQVFALYCVSRSGEMLSAYFIPLAYGLLPHHLMWPFSVWFTALLTSGLVSIWLHLQFVFPKPLEWVKRHAILAFSICYLPTLIALLFFFRRWIPGFPDLIPAFLDSSEQSYFVDWSYLVAGVAILLFRYHTSSDSIERRQLRLFIGGSAIGLVADAILEILYAFWFEWYDSTPYIDLIGTAIVYSATLLGPLSFVYAFRRYRLMDIEAKLRRGTRYALVTGTFLAVAIGFVFIVSRIVLDYTGVDSLTVTLALGFALSLGVVPAQRRINRYIEAKLYPERTRLQESLYGFLHQTITPSDLSGHWQSLTGLLRDRMNVQEVSLAKFGRGHDELDLGSALAKHLAFTKRALPIDEALLLDSLAVTRNILER
ncbi:MAG: hypothetical protein IPP40_09090 [bacterium]|nr:hypothetical protein [bacterium]